MQLHASNCRVARQSQPCQRNKVYACAELHSPCVSGVQAIVDLWDKVLDGYADLTVVSLTPTQPCTTETILYTHGAASSSC
jgi:hypothetical protein